MGPWATSHMVGWAATQRARRAASSVAVRVATGCDLREWHRHGQRRRGRASAASAASARERGGGARAREAVAAGSNDAGADGGPLLDSGEHGADGRGRPAPLLQAGTPLAVHGLFSHADGAVRDQALGACLALCGQPRLAAAFAEAGTASAREAPRRGDAWALSLLASK